MQSEFSGLKNRFRDVVTSEDQLREVVGVPSVNAVSF